MVIKDRQQKKIYIKMLKQQLKWLNEKKVKNNQIILYGESLGTGVAVEIGKKIPLIV